MKTLYIILAFTQLALPVSDNKKIIDAIEDGSLLHIFSRKKNITSELLNVTQKTISAFSSCFIDGRH